MRPQPDKYKTRVVMTHKGRELLFGPTYGKIGNSIDNPGGGGGDNEFFIRDTKKLQQEKTRKEWNHVLSLEKKLFGLHFKHTENKKDFERLLKDYDSGKSQEGNNSNK